MDPTPVVWQPRRKFQDRVWVNLLLVLLTILTTSAVGGLWYSGTALLILGSHELGHYLACRYYDVDASLPFFLPMPLPPFGTLGAFIRIREPIPEKRILFDIGIAGPIAGFLVLLPALFIGISWSRVVQIPPDYVGYEYGESLLIKLVSWLYFGTQPNGYSVAAHPVAIGAVFGMLATALNLFPIGQLDGGHISYTVLGRKSTYVTIGMVGVALVLTYFSSTWIVWTGLIILMLYRFGATHPPVYDETEPLDRARLLLAGFAIVMFVLCFTPTPLTFHDLLRR